MDIFYVWLEMIMWREKWLIAKLNRSLSLYQAFELLPAACFGMWAWRRFPFLLPVFSKEALINIGMEQKEK